MKCIVCSSEAAGQKQAPNVTTVVIATLAQIEINGVNEVMRGLCQTHVGFFNGMVRETRLAIETGVVVLPGG